MSSASECFLSSMQACRFGDHYFSSKVVFEESQGREGPFAFYFDDIIEKTHLKKWKDLSLPILQEIVECMKQGKDPDFSFLQADELQVKILFYLIDYLAMDDFQLKYLEPFNEKFPEISLQESPETVRQLVLEGKSVAGIDFRKFPQIEKINLSSSKHITSMQIAQISTTVEELDFSGVDVEGFIS